MPVSAAGQLRESNTVVCQICGNGANFYAFDFTVNTCQCDGVVGLETACLPRLRVIS